jgi:hypothetical protein
VTTPGIDPVESVGIQIIYTDQNAVIKIKATKCEYCDLFEGNCCDKDI